MKMKTYILGIDTSAYTTSIAAVDGENGRLIFDERKVLKVPEGQKGLRQQEAVFQHLHNFQELFQKINFDIDRICTVSVSSKPRNTEKSYMPVFVVGQNYGKVIAKSLKCIYTEYSHQENHIGASLINNYKEAADNMLAIHISGGTTEFLSVTKAEKGYNAEIIGGSRDITFGQLIDRIGTAMNFEFPCGLHMENFIDKNNAIEKLKLPPITKDVFINLSGMENYYYRLIESNKYNKETIIFSLFQYTASCIIYVINKLKKTNAFDTIIITGGVSANSIIRNNLSDNLGHEYNLIFPAKENSSDNAIGNAFLPIIDRWYNET